ncbi:MAG: hypothetical protein IKJ13_07610 [Clostridia bacterium]|nr:hypothetical protein [Clostridia bacterium]
MFDLKKILNGRMNVPEPEMHVAGVDIEPGMALTLSAGKLTACTGAKAPTHISMGIAKSGALCPCCTVNSEQRYEVPLSAAPTSLAEGDKVTIGTDSLTVTATKTDGVATIVALNGAAAAGDKIMIKF